MAKAEQKGGPGTKCGLPAGAVAENAAYPWVSFLLGLQAVSVGVL